MLIAVLLLAGSWSGCGGNSPPSPPTTTTVAPTTTTSSTSTTSTSTSTTTSTTAPPSTGFPDATNTGWSGTLAPSGTITTSSDGQVIEDLDISGVVRVNHNNVTIRNVKVSNGFIDLNPSTDGTVIEDCELDGSSQTSNVEAVRYARYEIRRCDIHGYGEGAKANGAVIIEDNYMHDFQSFLHQGAHHDGIQAEWGDNITIRHNTIDMGVDGANAAIFVQPNNDHSKVIVDDNLLASNGGFGAYDGTGGTANNCDVVFTNNRFSNKYHPAGGYYGTVNGFFCGTHYGNVIHETGESVD